MKTYPTYKPSGIEWIGEIPEHWEIRRVKRFAKILNGQDQKEVVCEDGIYPIYGSGGEFGRTNVALHQGPSVLLGRKGTIDKPRFVNHPFWSVDTAYYTDIYPQISPLFFFYACTTINFDLYKYGSAVPSMTQEVLNQIPFASPPLPEQTAIAAYLDAKTARIDGFIAAKQKLITLLKEERIGIINQAVTKGLNPNVPMKPSGIEWLDDASAGSAQGIPKHWEVKKLKYVAEINPSKSEIDNSIDKGSLVTFLPMEKVSESGVISCEIKKPISELISGFTYFRRDDIIVAKITPCFENGKGAFLNHLDTEIGFGSTEFHVLRANSGFQPGYLYCITKTDLFMSFGEAFMSGAAGQKRVPTDFVAEFCFPFPDEKEQIEILAYIKTETTKIDTTISKIEKEIELMQEYRTALINEVVTGKICVI